MAFKILSRVLREEETMWAQSQIQVVAIGGQKYEVFSNGCNYPKKSTNAIDKIKDTNGFLWKHGERLKQAFVQEFKLRVSGDSPPTHDNMAALVDIVAPYINNQHNFQFLKPVTNEEIWIALKSIRALNASGPDGLSVVFYHECWVENKDTVIPMIKEFF